MKTFLLAILLVLSAAQQQEKPYRVPDPDGGEGHYKRPDGKSCSMVMRDHPCNCFRCNTKGEPSRDTTCQNHCKPSKCDCECL